MALQVRFPQQHSSALAFQQLIIPQPIGCSQGLRVEQDGRAALLRLERLCRDPRVACKG